MQSMYLGDICGLGDDKLQAQGIFYEVVNGVTVDDQPIAVGISDHYFTLAKLARTGSNSRYDVISRTQLSHLTIICGDLSKRLVVIYKMSHSGVGIREYRCRDDAHQEDTWRAFREWFVRCSNPIARVTDTKGTEDDAIAKDVPGPIPTETIEPQSVINHTDASKELSGEPRCVINHTYTSTELTEDEKSATITSVSALTASTQELIVLPVVRSASTKMLYPWRTVALAVFVNTRLGHATLLYNVWCPDLRALRAEAMKRTFLRKTFKQQKEEKRICTMARMCTAAKVGDALELPEVEKPTSICVVENEMLRVENQACTEITNTSGPGARKKLSYRETTNIRVGGPGARMKLAYKETINRSHIRDVRLPQMYMVHRLYTAMVDNMVAFRAAFTKSISMYIRMNNANALNVIRIQTNGQAEAGKDARSLKMRIVHTIDLRETNFADYARTVTSHTKAAREGIVDISFTLSNIQKRFGDFRRRIRSTFVRKQRVGMDGKKALLYPKLDTSHCCWPSMSIPCSANQNNVLALQEPPDNIDSWLSRFRKSLACIDTGERTPEYKEKYHYQTGSTSYGITAKPLPLPECIESDDDSTSYSHKLIYERPLLDGADFQLMEAKKAAAKHPPFMENTTLIDPSEDNGESRPGFFKRLRNAIVDIFSCCCTGNKALD